MPEAALVLSLVLGGVSLPVLHELGHFVAGLLVGHDTRVDWRTLTASTTLAGAARAPHAVFLLAGPALNLLVGALLLLAVGASERWLGLLHLAFGALNLLPFPARTDGAKLLRLARSRTTTDEARTF